MCVYKSIPFLITYKEGSVCWFTGWAVNSIASAVEGSNPFLPISY